MKPAATETYRRRLLQLQERLVRRIYELDEELLHVTDRVIEYGEKAQAESPEEVLARLDDHSRQEWEAMQAALQRIEAGTYGRCDICDQAIRSARLDAMPMATRCLQCQEKIETA